MVISDELIRAIARSNLPAYVGIGDLARPEGHRLRDEAQDLERMVRNDYSVAIRMERAVSRLRLNVLRIDHSIERPVPLDHPDLESIPVDKHGLVPLSAFDRVLGGLGVGCSVFEILPA